MTVRETSLLAYTEVQEDGTAETMRQRVLNAMRDLNRLGKYPTDYEVARFMGFGDPNKVRPRRRGLVQQGRVRERGRRICSVTGKTALTWEAVE